MVNYHSSSDRYEIIIRDANMKKIETWKFSISDKKLATSVLWNIIRKNGLPFKRTDIQEDKTWIDTEIKF